MTASAPVPESVALSEAEFHDRWAESVDASAVLVDESWNAVTCPEHRWIREQIGNLQGKRVLDLGCGCGEAAVWFAKCGADVVACDLSPSFIDLVRRVAGLHRVSVEGSCSSAEHLPFAAATFDLVYAGNVLHHVEIDRALDEIHSVLKPGGILVTWDPLVHNPLIGIYRRLASDVRTTDEHPLRMADLDQFRKRFQQVKYECFWFFTLWLFLRFFLVEHVHPGRERYWKKIIIEHERLTPTYLRLEGYDQKILGAMPWLKRFCWNIAVSARKT
jgi:SAM-dependent methyltransferase